MKLCISRCHFVFHYADTTLCMTLSKRFLTQIDYVIIIINMADIEARRFVAIDIGGIDRRLGPRGVTFLKSKMAAQAGKKLK